MKSNDLKKTLLLPRTDFPIKSRRETQKQIANFWEEERIYSKSSLLNAEKKKFVVHDGPPYANGSIHVGHFVNRILKDLIIRFHNLTGYQVFFKLGWDTHGLPIESKVVNDKDKVNEKQIRKICREYADQQIEIQRSQLKQLGLFTDYVNNYSTGNNYYEARQLIILAEITEKKLIYRGLRPIYWSWSQQTALAENEIEYREKEDFSLFFKLELSGVFLTNSHVKLLIWTTQPWTIPGNMFVGIKPNSNYSLITSNGEFLICSSEYSEKFINKKAKILETFKGSLLLGLEYLLPYTNNSRSIVIDAGNLVKTEEGTGILHLAPACGLEDFLLVRERGVEISTLIDEKGNFCRENPVKELVGFFYQKANLWIIDNLKKRGLVESWRTFTHSYPHDWRDKSPLVYRLTNQWFINLIGIRQKLLNNIEKVEWTPSHSKEKMISFIKNRDDWCISRQRKWGVPIPVIHSNGKTILSPEIIRHVARLVEKEGSDFWFQEKGLELIRREFSFKFSQDLTLGTDTLDVWFDSGVSSFCVLNGEDSWPADIYLEGSDQFRGWFNSSLIISTIVKKLPPYKAVISHGFTVDKDGRKMSKSLGNTVDPLTLIETFGIDTLRLWVASVDFTKEIKISNQILLSVQDNYQKLRNCLRFIVASLFEVKKKDNPEVNTEFLKLYGEITNINEYIKESLIILETESKDNYLKYNFANIYSSVNNFCVNKLSTFYFEIIKDILYCDPQHSGRRQEILVIFNEILKKILVIIMPMIPFLAEEIYQTIITDRKNFTFRDDNFYSYNSINLVQTEKQCQQKSQYPKIKSFESSFLQLRKNVFRELEKSRQENTIETNQQAVVTLLIPESEQDKYFSYSDLSRRDNEKNLSLLFIVSEVNIKNADQFAIEIGKTSCLKCERCWRFIVNPHSELPLCLRCAEALNN